MYIHTPRFCIKMHVTKYGYNEFGRMVPWVSLYTKFTVILKSDPYQIMHK